MIAEINKVWSWKGFIAKEIMKINDFGNIIFKTESNVFWRICPEEVSCSKIAESLTEFDKLCLDSEFIEDWKMTNIIRSAKDAVGELIDDEKYSLKMPALFGDSIKPKIMEKFH